MQRGFFFLRADFFGKLVIQIVEKYEFSVFVAQQE